MSSIIDDNDNFKVKLHKICQKNRLNKPVYSTEVLEADKKHSPRYQGLCELAGPDGEQISSKAPIVKTKKLAEHLAAEDAYRQFIKRYPDASGVPKKLPKVYKKQQETNNKKDFINKLNKIIKSQGFPYPIFQTKPSTEGSYLCACRIDTLEGEHYSTGRGKTEYEAKQSAALAMLNLLDEDNRARKSAQALEVSEQGQKSKLSPQRR